MNVLQHLTLANLQKNKRRTAVTIIGVLLSTALILAVAGIVTSFQKMMINYAIADYGNYHEMYQEVPVEALKYVEENQHVESYYYSRPMSTDDVSEDDLNYYQLYQHSPYEANDYTRIDALPSDATGTYNIYVRYDNPRNYQANREAIQNALEVATGEYINCRTNDELLRYEARVMSDASLATLYSLATIVIVIIVVTSIFVIRNSFSISATERARQFGMLSSVGATPRQIRHSVLFEGLAIGLIGIPLGVLLGIAAVAVLVVVMNILLQDMLQAPVEFYMPFWIFPVTIVLSLVTIFFSSLMPAIRAGRMSPIDAIRGTQDIKIKAKKLRTSRLVKSTFGIGGVIADKNLKRSRKKYRTTVISIVLSVSTFIGLYSFMNYGLALTGLQFSDSNVDYAISGASPELYRELQDKFNLKDSAYYLQTSTTHVTIMEQSAFEKFAQSLGIKEKDYSHVAIMNPYYMGRDENGKSVLYHDEVKAGDKLTLEVQPVGAVPEKCRTITEDETGVSTQTDMDCYYAAVGKPHDIELSITKVTDQYPIGYDTQKYLKYIVVPENYYMRAELKAIVDLDDNGTVGNGRFIETTFFAENVDNGAEISDYIAQKLEGSNNDDETIYSQDVRELMSQMRRMYLLISIFLYGFIIVVTLIGVTNIFNTITTNIALRAKEFAMLKSIGMTSAEFNHMVRLESLMYASKALIIGIPLGLLISFGFYQSIAASVDFGWQIPWMAILISVIAVALLIGLIMRYSVKQVSKQNIIETIRSENI